MVAPARLALAFSCFQGTRLGFFALDTVKTGKVVEPPGNAPGPTACKAVVLAFITTAPYRVSMARRLGAAPSRQVLETRRHAGARRKDINADDESARRLQSRRDAEEIWKRGTATTLLLLHNGANLSLYSY